MYYPARRRSRTLLLKGREPLIYLKGDTIKLKSGETAEILECWGVARDWYKAKTSGGKIVYVMDQNIESLEKRYIDKRRAWGTK